jgi:hypothetical protein
VCIPHAPTARRSAHAARARHADSCRRAGDREAS